MTWQAELARSVGSAVVRADAIAGGDINDAHRVTLADGRTLFVKTHRAPPPGLYAAEADGLAWLSCLPGDGPLRVPGVIAVGERYLALEWLDLEGRDASLDEELGRRLALLHHLGAPAFGYPLDNYLATIPQPAVLTDDGPTFWVEHRLRPVMRRARISGCDARLDALLANRDRFGPPEPPARLHGDLWWGNVGVVAGAPVVFDPAVYGGHREVDLAMLALFGGVSPALVAAYHETYPLAEGWRERVPLWQLYPLAVHAALFGGSYGAQVARTLTSVA